VAARRAGTARRRRGADRALAAPGAAELGTVVRASALSVCDHGNDRAFEIDVVNQLGTPITLSHVAVDVVGAPSLRIALGPEGEVGPCGSGWPWSSAPARLTLAPNDLGVVFVGLPMPCQPDPGPIVKSVSLTIEAAGQKVSRNITPDPESLADINEHTAVTCDT
jgi:hypothetical protein